jgi:hypothetical protein
MPFHVGGVEDGLDPVPAGMAYQQDYLQSILQDPESINSLLDPSLRRAALEGVRGAVLSAANTAASQLKEQLQDVERREGMDDADGPGSQEVAQRKLPGRAKGQQEAQRVVAAKQRVGWRFLNPNPNPNP